MFVIIISQYSLHTVIRSMIKYFSLLCCVGIIFCVGFTLSDECSVVHWTLPVHNKKLAIQPMRSLRNQTINTCLITCFEALGCVAINFGFNDCELLKNDRHFLPSNFSQAEGWTYIQREVRKVRKLIISVRFHLITS